MNPACYRSGIDPDAIPGQDLDPDAVLAAAAGLAAGGTRVREAGAAMLREWRQLRASYVAPEAEQLLAVMDPVEAGARAYGDDVERVAAALRRYAEDVRPIKNALGHVRRDAWTFRDSIASIPDWEYDQDLVDENAALIRRVNAQQVALWDVERACANAIRALYRAPSWHAATSNEDPLGYGLADLGEDTETAWGAAVERKDHCPKSAAVGAKRFVWDGLVVDGLWGTVTGLGLLVGIDGTDWDRETFQQSWVGMSSLIGFANHSWTPAHAGEAWRGLGKGLLAWDRWSEDPARAAGGAVFNLGTIVVPAGAAAAGTRSAATVTATGVGARTATVLARAAEVVKFTDPITLTTMGVKAALPRLADLTAGIWAATERLSDLLRMPDLRVPDLHLPEPSTPVIQVPAAVPHPSARVRSHGHIPR